MTLVMSPPAPLSPTHEHLTALRSAWPGDHLAPFLPAAMNDSCPPIDPGNLTQDVDFSYEVCPSHLLSTFVVVAIAD